jgi:hypothetical protein
MRLVVSILMPAARRCSFNLFGIKPQVSEYQNA